MSVCMCRSWGDCVDVHNLGVHGQRPSRSWYGSPHSLGSLRTVPTPTLVCVDTIDYTRSNSRDAPSRTGVTYNRLSPFMTSLKTLFLWIISCCDSHHELMAPRSGTTYQNPHTDIARMFLMTLQYWGYDLTRHNEKSKQITWLCPETC